MVCVRVAACCPLLNVCALLLLRVLTPHRSMLGGWLDRKQVGMAFVFTQQSLFKHLLTQGDKIVLTLASSLFNQGVYAVVTNYGRHTRTVGCFVRSRSRCGTLHSNT